MKTKQTIYKLHTLIDDMPSETYHQGTPGTYSSSQLKDLLDDEDFFIKKHVKKEIERESIDAFDVGTYFHTGVLEPHKLKTDCVVYPGKVRRGKDWEKFKKKNAGRNIVTDAQKSQAEGLVKIVTESKTAKSLLEPGEVEISLFVKLVVLDGQIYAPYFARRLTLKDGWVQERYPNLMGQELIIKVRADKFASTHILDLKSTTGNAKSNMSMRQKISYYNYDLSAALYLDMFRLMNPQVKKFWWIFASKDYFNSKCYEASQNNILVGRAKYMKALKKLAECTERQWKTTDYPDILEPLPHEMEWIIERDRDLL